MPRKMLQPINNIAPELLAGQVEIVELDSLIPDPQNARLHPEPNIETIMASFVRYGQDIPLVCRKANRVIVVGNGRREAAKRLGWTRMAVIFREMSELDAVGRGLVDNRAAEMAVWDHETLARLTRLQEEAGEAPLGWTTEDLMALRMQGTAQGDPEDVPPAPLVPITKLGDIWVLGEHRLMCGDSSSREVEKMFTVFTPVLMVTDPPYGVDYDADWRNHSFRADGSPIGGRAIGKVINDDNWSWKDAYALFPGNTAYIWCASLRSALVHSDITSVGFVPNYLIIWNKDGFVISRGDYHWKHEPCWYATRKGKNHNWQGSRSETTVWDIPRPKKSETGHSTQKPIECMARPIRNNSAAGECVYDPFVGSGTTIIAAQQLARQCLAVEINPAYCDVTLERWANFTGLDPIRERDGKTWSELKKKRPQVVPAARNGKA